MKTKSIAIIGCGWLGEPLAYHLQNVGYEVKGTTTSASKIEQLRKAGIDAHAFDLLLDTDLPKAVLESDVVIVTIPPLAEALAFKSGIAKTAGQLAQSPVQQVIYTSSTSVYPDLNREVHEHEASLEAKSRKGMSMLEIENIFHDALKERFVAIRFGGLFGNERHPVKQLSGKTNLPGGRSPVNLIHLHDCIQILEHLIKHAVINRRLNACHPDHPTKQEYYLEAARILGLTPPVFKDELSAFKQVSSDTLIQEIGYQFQTAQLSREV